MLDDLIRGAEIAAGVLAFITIGAFIVCWIEDRMHRDKSYDWLRDMDNHEP